jgi:alpha-amylase
MAKYPEINNMHKKMLLISRRLNQLRVQAGDVRLQEAKDHLWASQCNCPYWHGVFGGAYLNNLRYANYHEMLQAETIVDELEHGGDERKNGWVEISQQDMDADSEPEVLVSAPSLNVYLKPQIGGSIFELDYKPKAINLSDTMSRREEAYHRKLSGMQSPSAVPEQMSESGLFYDWYRRTSLVDHFLKPGTTLEAFASARYSEQGDFVNQPYLAMVEERKQPLQVTLSRRGAIWIGDMHWPIEVCKSLRFDLKFPNCSLITRLKICNPSQ